jgi:hypothetical protein
MLQAHQKCLVNMFGGLVTQEFRFWNKIKNNSIFNICIGTHSENSFDRKSRRKATPIYALLKIQRCRNKKLS